MRTSGMGKILVTEDNAVTYREIFDDDGDDEADITSIINESSLEITNGEHRV